MAKKFAITVALAVYVCGVALAWADGFQDAKAAVAAATKALGAENLKTLEFYGSGYDYAIGQAVRARGMTVAIPSFFVAHACSEESAAELLRHELRWARTTRAVNAARSCLNPE